MYVLWPEGGDGVASDVLRQGAEGLEDDVLVWKPGVRCVPIIYLS